MFIRKSVRVLTTIQNKNNYVKNERKSPKNNSSDSVTIEKINGNERR